MGLFESIFGKKAEPQRLREARTYFKTLTAYEPAFRTWSGSIYESELVRSAIDARARHIAKLKVEILGSARQQLQTKLKLRPNDFLTWYQFLYRLSTILDVHNTAIILPVKDKSFETVGIFPVLPEKCEIVQTKDGEPVLRFTFANKQVGACYLNECSIMTKFQYKSDFFGESNHALIDTMDLINMETQGIKEAIKNGATYRFMAQSNNFALTDDLANERKRFSNENFSKEAEAGGLLLFPNTYKDIKQIESKPYTINPDERKLIQENVFNYFAVNEHILQSKATGDEWDAFYESVVETFAIQFSEVTTKMLFTDREQGYGAKVMATANRLQYMSNKDKLSVSAAMADRGLMMINEIRDIWNLPPVPDGDKRTARGEYYILGEGDAEEEPNNETQEDNKDNE